MEKEFIKNELEKIRAFTDAFPMKEGLPLFIHHIRTVPWDKITGPMLSNDVELN